MTRKKIADMSVTTSNEYVLRVPSIRTRFLRVENIKSFHELRDIVRCMPIVMIYFRMATIPRYVCLQISPASANTIVLLKLLSLEQYIMFDLYISNDLKRHHANEIANMLHTNSTNRTTRLDERMCI